MDICYLSDINDNGGTFVEISDLLQRKFDGGVDFSNTSEKKFDEPILSVKEISRIQFYES